MLLQSLPAGFGPSDWVDMLALPPLSAPPPANGYQHITFARLLPKHVSTSPPARSSKCRQPTNPAWVIHPTPRSHHRTCCVQSLLRFPLELLPAPTSLHNSTHTKQKALHHGASLPRRFPRAPHPYVRAADALADRSPLNLMPATGRRFPQLLLTPPHATLYNIRIHGSTGRTPVAHETPLEAVSQPDEEPEFDQLQHAQVRHHYLLPALARQQLQHLLLLVLRHLQRQVVDAVHQTGHHRQLHLRDDRHIQHLAVLVLHEQLHLEDVPQDLHGSHRRLSPGLDLQHLAAVQHLVQHQLHVRHKVVRSHHCQTVGSAGPAGAARGVRLGHAQCSGHQEKAQQGQCSGHGECGGGWIWFWAERRESLESLGCKALRFTLACT
uniref:Uncharacterized protein n=1 Tax=Physcomitrium patens TaxID=3218 RepID=A0A2K1JRR8_PHYPA|nr:hypothetical protein PHYPA_016613 [Physcomitrium patens]